MHKARQTPVLLAVLLMALAGGCADQGRYAASQAEVRRAVAAAEAENAWWRAPFKGMDATLRPESGASGGHKMILQAIYRVNEGGEAKFALFLAQGLKLGQCARSGKNVTCTNRNFPGASRLVRGAFAALDEIFALSPERFAECELRRGDSRAGLDGSQLLLRRRLPTRAGQSAGGGDSYVLTNLAGRILAVYRLGHSVDSRGRLERPLAWKATFGEKQNYRFMPRDGGWIMDVSITRRLE